MHRNDPLLRRAGAALDPPHRARRARRHQAVLIVGLAVVILVGVLLVASAAFAGGGGATVAPCDDSATITWQADGDPTLGPVLHTELTWPGGGVAPMPRSGSVSGVPLDVDVLIIWRVTETGMWYGETVIHTPAGSTDCETTTTIVETTVPIETTTTTATTAPPVIETIPDPDPDPTPTPVVTVTGGSTERLPETGDSMATLWLAGGCLALGALTLGVGIRLRRPATGS